MSGNDGYTTGNSLDYLYHWKYYKLIGIDLSRQKIRILLNKLILQEDKKKMMQQCVLLLKSSKKQFSIFL